MVFARLGAPPPLVSPAESAIICVVAGIGDNGGEYGSSRELPTAVGEAPRDEVRQLDEQIEAINQKLALNGKTKELLTKQLAYLDQLEGFVAPTAKTELSQGVLDAEALKQITLFSFEQRQEFLNKQVEN